MLGCYGNEVDIHKAYMPERKDIDMVYPSVTLTQDEMFSLFKNMLLKRDVSNPGKVELLKKLYNINVREVDTYLQQFFSLLEKLNILRCGLLAKFSPILFIGHKKIMATKRLVISRQ